MAENGIGCRSVVRKYKFSWPNPGSLASRSWIYQGLTDAYQFSNGRERPALAPLKVVPRTPIVPRSTRETAVLTNEVKIDSLSSSRVSGPRCRRQTIQVVSFRSRFEMTVSNGMAYFVTPNNTAQRLLKLFVFAPWLERRNCAKRSIQVHSEIDRVRMIVG
jgi:hypothetical protein